MDRDIKFRGKHTHILNCNKPLNGIWVYGYLADENYINSPELEGEFLVDKDTVGQYVGVKDNNGKEIYEGDIVRLPKCENDIAIFELKGCNYFLKGKRSNYEIGSCDSTCYEIIGNIYENMDLLN